MMASIFLFFIFCWRGDGFGFALVAGSEDEAFPLARASTFRDGVALPGDGDYAAADANACF